MVYSVYKGAVMTPDELDDHDGLAYEDFLRPASEDLFDPEGFKHIEEDPPLTLDDVLADPFEDETADIDLDLF